MRKISEEPTIKDKSELLYLPEDTENCPGRKENRRQTIATLRKNFNITTSISSKPQSFIQLAPRDLNRFEKTEEADSPIVAREKGDFSVAYQQLETLGQGSCAVVKKVRREQDGQYFVAKIARPRDIEYLNQMRKEFNIQSKLDHHYITKAYDFLSTQAESKTYIIMEFFNGKTIQSLIEEKTALGEETTKKIIFQLLQALHYIHTRGICHRDVTAANVMVNDYNEIKLIDFSVATIFSEEKWSKSGDSPSLRKKSLDDHHLKGYMLTSTGTNEYKAPEIILGAPYSQSVDMWSVGILTYYAISGKLPFKAKFVDKLLKKITEAKVDLEIEEMKNVSKEAKLFIKACLTKTPLIRLTPKEALYHPWIKGVKLDTDSPVGSSPLTIIRLSSPQVPNTFQLTEKRDFTPKIKRKTSKLYEEDD